MSGGPTPIDLFFDLRYGECLEVVRLAGPAQRPAEVVLAGPLTAWQRVLQKKLSLLQSITTKELSITSGPSVNIMGAHRAAQALVDVVGAIETEWPA